MASPRQTFRNLRHRYLARRKQGKQARKLKKAMNRWRIKAFRRPPLRSRALKVAQSLIGVMEHGGNNRGETVSKIIRENGGGGPEPWCGDFVAYCYRHAGSKRVQRAWASVAALRGLLGINAAGKPQPGDLVRFTFDHVGLFEKDLGNGYIQTIEGNTGASGAVSDSSTGGDGVYRKKRAKGLVRDYLHVHG